MSYNSESSCCSLESNITVFSNKSSVSAKSVTSCKSFGSLKAKATVFGFNPKYFVNSVEEKCTATLFERHQVVCDTKIEKVVLKRNDFSLSHQQKQQIVERINWENEMKEAGYFR
jgi:hypothetical protein